MPLLSGIEGNGGARSVQQRDISLPMAEQSWKGHYVAFRHIESNHSGNPRTLQESDDRMVSLEHQGQTCNRYFRSQ